MNDESFFFLVDAKTGKNLNRVYRTYAHADSARRGLVGRPRWWYDRTKDERKAYLQEFYTIFRVTGTPERMD